MIPAGTASQINYRRNLDTYINGLLGLQYSYPQSYQEINDAIIAGRDRCMHVCRVDRSIHQSMHSFETSLSLLTDIQFGIGSANPSSSTFVRKAILEPGNFTWAWSFDGFPTPSPTAAPTAPTGKSFEREREGKRGAHIRIITSWLISSLSAFSFSLFPMSKSQSLSHISTYCTHRFSF